MQHLQQHLQEQRQDQQQQQQGADGSGGRDSDSADRPSSAIGSSFFSSSGSESVCSGDAGSGGS